MSAGWQHRATSSTQWAATVACSDLDISSSRLHIWPRLRRGRWCPVPSCDRSRGRGQLIHLVWNGPKYLPPFILVGPPTIPFHKSRCALCPLSASLSSHCRISDLSTTRRLWPARAPKRRLQTVPPPPNAIWTARCPIGFEIKASFSASRHRRTSVPGRGAGRRCWPPPGRAPGSVKRQLVGIKACLWRTVCLLLYTGWGYKS
jgi:hypothetical protein